MEITDYKAKLLYFAREGLYNLMASTCKEAMAKYSGEISFNFYRSVCFLLNGNYTESIRELEVIKSEHDIELASVVALMYSYKYIGTNDKALFQNLDSRMKELKKSATVIDLYNTSLLFFVLKKFDKALDYTQKVIHADSTYWDAWSLKGWILIMQFNPDSDSKIIVQAFETAMNNNKKHLDSTLGLSHIQMLNNNIDEAITTINKAIVRYPNINTPLIQKMRILFTTQDWDQTTEVMNRLLSAHPKNIEAFKTNILILICRDSNYPEAAEHLKALIAELECVEPKTADYYYQCSILFSRICARNSLILNETFNMCETAVKLAPRNSDYITELGYQCLLQGRIYEATKFYKAATKINSSSFEALLGMTLCELSENGKSENVKQQIFFLLELQENVPPPLLLLMRAKLSESTELVIQLLEEATQAQLKLVEAMPYSEQYLRLLDPDLMMDIIREYLQYAPNSSTSIKNFNSPPTKQDGVINSILTTLQVVTKACPGLQEALYLLAKVQYLKGDNSSALSTLNHIINNIDSTSSDALLLMAQIQINSNMYERAAQSLEVGLSHNFKVRENPLFHYINGLVEKHRGNIEESIKLFTTAFSLIDIKQRGTSYTKSEETVELTLADKASIYVELIKAHGEARQVHEAGKLLEDAMQEFKNTPEESRMLVLSAQQALAMNEVQIALGLLGKVKAGDSCYSESKTMLADVLLKKCGDKRAYLKSYQDMVANSPDSKSYVLLGDAYLKVLEPSLALDSYRTALTYNPLDPHLTSTLGQALITTHHYSAALTFYQDTIKQTDDPELKLQLAELYMLLGHTAQAEQVLSAELEAGGRRRLEEDVTALQYKTRLFRVLARCQETAGKVREAIGTWKSAREVQTRVRRMLMVAMTAVPESENLLSVEINTKLAELSANVRDFEQAINHYKDALVVSPNNHKILAALAKLYMQMNYLELCQQTCTTLLAKDPDNEAASVMMADIAFRKVDFDMSVFHFTQLVTKQPSNWHALVRLVEVMRRTGSLDEVPQYLEQGQRFAENPSKEPGLSYATALYQWYSGNLNAALRNFNIARQDSEWGQQAIYNMIEICLNTEDELLGDQFSDPEDFEYRDARSMALKTAERLLKELRTKSQLLGEAALKCRILTNFLSLATREKPRIEAALEDFISIASQDAYRDHLGPILGMSLAYTLLKQSQRAKNQLKRVAKSPWTFEDAEYLERCWLLLAEGYVSGGKLDMGGELLRKVLQYNKGCGKGWEWAGLVAEKEQRYKEAANSYEQAWKYNGKNSPVLGYKLAYTLMKCKKYADAIDVGQQILKTNPEYPRVKKDILDKSIHNLRT